MDRCSLTAPQPTLTAGHYAKNRPEYNMKSNTGLDKKGQITEAFLYSMFTEMGHLV